MAALLCRTSSRSRSGRRRWMLEKMRVPASPRSSRHSASMSSMTLVAASASLSLSWPKKRRIAPLSSSAEGNQAFNA
jgi:hypothetical protein